MPSHVRSIVYATLAVSSVLAQLEPGTVPLADKRFDYTNLPYKADEGTGNRGTQYGYNRCNSTTEGPESLCQTALINSIDDFCLWGAPHPDSIVGNTEGESVAWCTKPGRGTRIIPEGALEGVQFMRTPDYIQVVGHIKQELINIQADDSGGEMDPHGADLRGNPLGGLVYSNAFPSNGGNADRFQQVIEWHNFMGGRVFCFKACDPAGANDARYCEHIYDRVGCNFNAPADYAAIKGQFISCEGDSQDFPGIYTDAAGAVQTYQQPPEGQEITALPFTPKIPSSSNCQTFTSAQLYANAPQATVTPAGPSSSPRPTSTGGAASGASSSPTGRLSTGRPNGSSPSAPTSTSTNSGAPNGAVAVGVDGAGAFFGTAALAFAVGLVAVVMA